MIKYSVIILVVIIAGCTMSRSMEVKATGSNIETIYGDGSAGFQYKSNTKTGFLNGK